MRNNFLCTRYQHLPKDVLSLGRLVSDLSPRQPGFKLRTFLLGFLVDTIQLEQFFLLALRFPPVTIIPSFLHADLVSCHKPNLPSYTKNIYIYLFICTFIPYIFRRNWKYKGLWIYRQHDVLWISCCEFKISVQVQGPIQCFVASFLLLRRVTKLPCNFQSGRQKPLRNISWHLSYMSIVTWHVLDLRPR